MPDGDWNWEVLGGPFGGTAEGPVWDGQAVLFTVIDKSVILRYDPAGGAITEFRKYTSRTNGLGFSPAGELYGCQQGSRRIVRFNADGSTAPMPYLLDGRYHNQPNDLVVDSRGRIWFSDPFEYGLDIPSRGPQPHPVVNHGSVLRLDPQGSGWQLRRMTFDTLNPNGVLLSKDERTLYVAETALVDPGVRELRAYPVLDDDTLGPYRVLHTFTRDHRGRHRGVDGMCLDSDGNILACTGWRQSGPGPQITVFDASGRVVATHPTPEDRPSNCCFGGPDLADLYVTTITGYLLRARSTGHRGWVLWPKS